MSAAKSYMANNNPHSQHFGEYNFGERTQAKEKPTSS
jgi:hypothetical protein